MGVYGEGMDPPRLMEGVYAFSWSPTVVEPDGRRLRVGGNFPILVDQETGECRHVRGLVEYRKLEGRG